MNTIHYKDINTYTRLNDLYVMLEYETDEDTIQEIKEEIRQLESDLDNKK